MNNTGVTYVAKYFTNKALSAFFVVMIVIRILFFKSGLPLLWLGFAVVTVLFFFNSLHTLTRIWSHYPEKVFRRRLFMRALLYRSIVVVFLYFFFDLRYGSPFEYGAADALFYNHIGIGLSRVIVLGDFDFGYWLRDCDFSDRGYPVFLAFVFVICFESVLMSRIVNAIFGAWMCVLIYDLTKRNFNEATARIASIIAMLLPNFLYYAGLSLKETVMVFCVVACINAADKVLRSRRFIFKDVLAMTVSGGALFFFRTVLGVTIAMTVLTSVIVLSSRVSTRGRRVFLGFWIVLALLAIFSTTIGATISKLMSQRDNNQEAQMQHFSNRQGGNAFAKYGKFSIFLPMILVAPFPTFVNTDQEAQMMLSGGFFTRNIYAFFVILALITMYKQKILRKHALIIIAMSSYLLMLASTGFALSERFHMPAVPFLVILAAYGITQVNAKNVKYFNFYVVLVSLIVIGWNWFKLAGRGM